MRSTIPSRGTFATRGTTFSPRRPRRQRADRLWWCTKGVCVFCRLPSRAGAVFSISGVDRLAGIHLQSAVGGLVNCPRARCRCGQRPRHWARPPNPSSFAYWRRSPTLDRLGLPLLAMTMHAGGDQKHLVETLRHAASVAVDFGDDLVKLPLGRVAGRHAAGPGDACPIPISPRRRPTSDAVCRFIPPWGGQRRPRDAAGPTSSRPPDPAAKTRDVRNFSTAPAVARRAQNRPNLAERRHPEFRRFCEVQLATGSFCRDHFVARHPHCAAALARTSPNSPPNRASRP